MIYWILAQMHPAWGLTPLHERPALLYSVALMLLGGQLMSMGFLAELILAYHAPRLTPYSIADEIPPRRVTPRARQRRSRRRESRR